MAKVNTIMCICPAGLGSSLILSMNVEKVLEKLGRTDIVVKHSSLGDTYNGCADLLVSADVYDQVKQYAPTVAIHNLINKDHIYEVLKQYFDENPDA